MESRGRALVLEPVTGLRRLRDSAQCLRSQSWTVSIVTLTDCVHRDTGPRQKIVTTGWCDPTSHVTAGIKLSRDTPLSRIVTLLCHGAPLLLSSSSTTPEES